MTNIVAPPPEVPLKPAAPPTFSVVVAAYQVAHLIGDALDSALSQTFPPYEVIVCDDGSADNLARTLAPYRDRVTLVSHPHRGEGAAKRAAAQAASGDFVVILDADDIFLGGRLEALARLAAVRSDLDILTTDAYFDVDGEPLPLRYTEIAPFEVDDQRREILRRNFIFGLAAARRHAVEAVGGFDEALTTVADWDLWIRMILAGSRVGLVAEPLARYRLREGNVTSDPLRLLHGELRVLEKTRRRVGLTEHDRRTVEASLRSRRSALALATLELALRERHVDARRRALNVVLGPNFRSLERLKAAASYVAPAMAGAFLERKERQTGVSRVKRWIPSAGA